MVVPSLGIPCIGRNEGGIDVHQMWQGAVALGCASFLVAGAGVNFVVNGSASGCLWRAQ